MNSEHEMEVRGIFSLLNPTDSKELDIQHMNTLLQKLDTIASVTERPQENKAPEEVTINPLPPQVCKTRKASSVITGMRRIVKESFIRKVDSRVKITREMVVKRHTSTPYILASKLGQEETQEVGSTNITKELDMFPNEKKSLNLNEFATLCDETLVNKPINDRVLLKCFSVFDHEQKGYIDPKMIKEILEIFNEKVTEEEAENLFKFLGCNNEMMTFHELKNFFKKNL